MNHKSNNNRIIIINYYLLKDKIQEVCKNF